MPTVCWRNYCQRSRPTCSKPLRTITGRGRTANLPPWVIFRHVVNHGTYHRGQVASKLKRLGVEQPATDFIYFAFEKLSAKP